LRQIRLNIIIVGFCALELLVQPVPLHLILRPPTNTRQSAALGTQWQHGEC
jgi:hypothetical protein